VDWSWHTPKDTALLAFIKHHRSLCADPEPIVEVLQAEKCPCNVHQPKGEKACQCSQANAAAEEEIFISNDNANKPKEIDCLFHAKKMISSDLGMHHSLQAL
jgi:hypothetical protein